MSDITKTPWKLDGELAIVTASRKELHIATVNGYSRSHKEDCANAAYIVQAVNSHEALVEAIQGLLDLVDREDLDYTWRDKVASARAALAKAKGQQ